LDGGVAPFRTFGAVPNLQLNAIGQLATSITCQRVLASYWQQVETD